MKIHKISWMVALIGILIGGASYIRWTFVWYDDSQAYLGLMIGAIIVGFAYLYNWMKDVDERFEKQSKRIDAMLSWWTKQEFKEVDK